MRLGETSVQAAQRHFRESKALKARAEGMKKGVADLESKLKKLEEKAARPAEENRPKVKVREARKREWFEAYRWFNTSGGRLVIAGRDAKQNEALFARHLEEGDLFFHADIAGGAATILKDGANASGQEKKETAQWAACFSKAWKLGYASLDVYCVAKGQVSKAAPSGEYLQKGSFMMLGRKEWFRGTPLALSLCIGEGGRLVLLPEAHAGKPQKSVRLAPGPKAGLEAWEVIKARLGLNSAGEVQPLLPGSVDID